MSLLIKNYSLVEVIHLLIKFNNSLLWNTENTDRNGINEQNANTTQTDNFRKGQLMLISDTSPYLE